MIFLFELCHAVAARCDLHTVPGKDGELKPVPVMVRLFGPGDAVAVVEASGWCVKSIGGQPTMVIEAKVPDDLVVVRMDVKPTEVEFVDHHFKTPEKRAGRREPTPPGTGVDSP